MKRLILATLAVCTLAIGCQKPVKEIPVSSVSIDKSSLVLVPGDSQTLVATVNPKDATDPTLTWSSDKSSVATVSKDGKVTAITEGEALITARAGSKSASCKVIVKEPDYPGLATAIAINPATVTLTEGQAEQLTVEFTPASFASSRELEWASVDDRIATVDQNGLVTAVAEGNTTVFARLKSNTSLQASCKVHVEKDATLKGIFFVVESVTMNVGDSQKFTINYNPSYATNKTISSWVSSNPSVVSVAADGTVKALAKGQATITATSQEGGFTASCLVDVISRTVKLYYISSMGNPSVYCDGEILYSDHLWVGDFIFYNNDLYSTNGSRVTKNGSVIRSWQSKHYAYGLSVSDAGVYFATTIDDKGAYYSICKASPEGELIALQMNDVKERKIKLSVTRSDGMAYFLGYDKDAFNSVKAKMWELNPQNEVIKEIAIEDYSERYSICLDENENVIVISSSNVSYKLYKNGVFEGQYTLDVPAIADVLLKYKKGNRYIAYTDKNQLTRIYKNDSLIYEISLSDPDISYVGIDSFDVDSDGNVYSSLSVSYKNEKQDNHIYMNNSQIYSHANKYGGKLLVVEQ